VFQRFFKFRSAIISKFVRPYVYSVPGRNLREAIRVVCGLRSFSSCLARSCLVATGGDSAFEAWIFIGIFDSPLGYNGSSCEGAFFAANLNPEVYYPAVQQQAMIAALTRLGVPDTPLQVEGRVTDKTERGTQTVGVQFSTTARYPKTRATFFIVVTRRHGAWQIDSFTGSWDNEPASAPSP
jgi:hypothetical protein